MLRARPQAPPFFVCLLKSETKGFFFHKYRDTDNYLSLYSVLSQNETFGGWECGSVLKDTPTVFKALGSTASATKINKLPLVPKIKHLAF